MVGMHGSYPANVAMYESDLVFAAGVRFDDRATGIVKKFCPSAKILHIDIDAAEINKILPTTLSLVCKTETAVPLITDSLKNILKNQDSKEFAQERGLWAEKIRISILIPSAWATGVTGIRGNPSTGLAIFFLTGPFWNRNTTF